MEVNCNKSMVEKVGQINGKMILVTSCQGFAPSSFADSNTSIGIRDIAPLKNRIFVVKLVQMLYTTMVGVAVEGRPSNPSGGKGFPNFSMKNPKGPFGSIKFVNAVTITMLEIIAGK